MYEKSDKRRLYWLINKYLNNEIDERTFCDEFYYSYSLELNNEELTDIERKMFYELDLVVSRFSEFESDHELDINAFSTVEELRKKAIDVREKLSLI
ncbi:colicin immunity domain-containing protein [Pedobacter deserti]|uniref:colicin immunity domain-containing protein n=1 Tax=Pedobacter deserti TaxID=2817382 RepID=UPI00210E0660|nr:colicin immunity domain-containing protein [Pedobacter sp. SYSU D00382]